MSDIHCWRCNEKIGWQEPGASGVTIKCVCGAKNPINPRIPAPRRSLLDKSAVLVAT